MQKSMKYCMLWNAGGNIAYIGVLWIVTVMVTRISGFRDAGLLSLAMSVSATFQTLSLYGIRNYQVSDTDNKYSNSVYVGFRHYSSLATVLLCLIFSLINRYSFEQVLAIMLYLFFRIAESYSDVLHGIAQKNGRLDVAGKSLSIKAISVLIFFFGGYLLFKNLNAGLALMAASSVISTVFYDYITVKNIDSFKLFEESSLCFKLAKETLPLCVYAFLFSALATIPKLVLENIHGEQSLGVYSSIFAPVTIIQAATAYIYNPFATVFSQQLADRKIKEFKATFLKIVVAIIAIMGLTIIFASFLGKPLLTLILGEKVSDYVYLLNPIIVAAITLSLLGFMCMLETVLRDFKGIIISCSIGFISNLVCSLIFIKNFDLNGTSYALIASNVFTLVLLSVFTFLKLRRYTDE